MEEENQSRPFSLSCKQTRRDEEKQTSNKAPQRRILSKCVMSWIASFVILAILGAVLGLTVFRVKDPVIIFNRITIPSLSLASEFPPTLKIITEVGVKNQNAVAFKHGDGIVLVYFHDKKVGQGYFPRGTVKARRTRTLNLSMEIVTAEILAEPDFVSEFSSGVLTVSSCIRLDGRVRIMKIIKKKVVVTINCTISTSIMSQEILDQNCMEKVSL